MATSTTNIGSLRTGAVVLLVAVSAVACSSSGGTTAGSTPSAPGASSSSALSGTPVQVGVLVDESSQASVNGVGNAAVAAAWEQYANAQGGVGGHQVKVVVKDTKGDSATALSATNSLATAGVGAALVLDSATMGITVPALNKAGVPVVGGFLSSPQLLGKLSNVWALYPSLGPLVTVIVEAAKAGGFTRGAVLECTVQAACSAADAPLQAALGATGGKWLGAIPYAITAANFTAPCLSAINKGANFIQVSAPASVAQRIMTDCRTQGYKGAFSSNVEVVNAANALQVAKNTVVGALLAFPWFADAAPVRTYTDAMKQFGVQNKYWQDNGAANVWASLELLRKVLNSNKATLSPSVTPADVIKAYGTVKNETLDGLIPQPVTFTANQPQAPILCGFTYEFTGGAYKTLKAGLTPTCASS